MLQDGVLPRSRTKRSSGTRCFELDAYLLLLRDNTLKRRKHLSTRVVTIAKRLDRCVTVNDIWRVDLL
ncbi:hypothetical protein A6I77_14845 [Achromobacter xylosoxidans]|nr:hypothetical protein A6I77_14845 [Achromobacter xylosoxidans]